jgi:hypothetical protein
MEGSCHACFTYHPSICLGKHRAPTKACQDSQSLVTDLRLGHLKYKVNNNNNMTYSSSAKQGQWKEQLYINCY